MLALIMDVFLRTECPAAAHDTMPTATSKKERLEALAANFAETI